MLDREPFTFEIRPIDSGDAKEWERLRSELWPDGAADHYVEIASFFAGTLAEPEAVLVVIAPDGEMIAFAELAIRTDLAETANQKTGYIEGLYVIPEGRFRVWLVRWLRHRAHGPKITDVWHLRAIGRIGSLLISGTGDLASLLHHHPHFKPQRRRFDNLDDPVAGVDFFA